MLCASPEERVTVVLFRAVLWPRLNAAMFEVVARDCTEAVLVMDAKRGPVPAEEAPATGAKQSRESAIRAKLEIVCELHDPQLIPLIEREHFPLLGETTSE